jgi:hypothetical protein
MSCGKRISAMLAACLAASGLIVAALVTAALASTGAGASSIATASAHGCDLTTHEQRHLGASYVTSLKVSNTTCSKGKKVVKAFHECRLASGGANGKCHHRVLHYRCGEHRYDAVPHVQYNSKVKCTRGDRVVRHTYTQNV